MVSKGSTADESRLVQWIAAVIYSLILICIAAAILVKIVISIFPSLGW